jgi:hypothetical protein
MGSIQALGKPLAHALHATPIAAKLRGTHGFKPKLRDTHVPLL